MKRNQNIQKSILLKDDIACIQASSNNKNIVHKKYVTSTMQNNNILTPRKKSQSHNG